MKVVILEPHGFCAGVANALRKANELLAASPAGVEVYCLHELVHNELVVGELRRKGMVFVESLADVPRGATVLFSAHGVSPAIRAEATARQLNIVDATCPFVARVHKAAIDFAARGLQVVVIGHRNHAEVKGITGEISNPIVIDSFPHPNIPASRYPNFSTSLGVVSQTTMNADDVGGIVENLRRAFKVESTAEVCHATKERQDAVKAFEGDALLVLGSAQSSNTRRLCEVARCRTFRAGTMEDVKAIDCSGIGCLGVTSGASTPEEFFKEAVTWLQTKEDAQ